MGDISKEFEQRYGAAPDWVVVAPGRVNLIGEHTDSNDGFVLPMAIERYTTVAAGHADGESRVAAFSSNLDEADSFDVDAASLAGSGKWTDHIKGVFAEFLDRGLRPQGLNLYVHSDVPIGCGLSSSAALQIAMAKVLQQLQPGLVEDGTIAKLCQMAEHNFAGVPCGIMDQFCIAYAHKDHLVYLDCRSLEAEHVHFDDPEVAVLIVDSGVSRELRSGAYAERRRQCEEAAASLGVSHLRDATIESLEAKKEELGDVRYRRARHVTGEDVRTAQAVAAIRARDWPTVGELMYGSHESLARDFEVSCEELDVLVDLARRIGCEGGVYGSRMTGGGFGGCTVSLVERPKAAGIIETLTHGYRQSTGIDVNAYVSSPAQGVRVVDA